MRHKIALLTLPFLALSACGEGGSEQQTAKAEVQADPADEVAFPKGYASVAYKCDGRNMVYVAGKGGHNETVALAVVADDPRCKVDPK